MYVPFFICHTTAESEREIGLGKIIIFMKYCGERSTTEKVRYTKIREVFITIFLIENRVSGEC